MADTNKPATGSSPWGEPLDETKVTPKLQPSVVGDLDFRPDKEQTNSGVTAPLKVPSNVEEKVGAKIAASNVVASTAPQPTPTGAKGTNQEAAKGGSDFWQNVYGQATTDQGLSAAPAAAAKPVQMPTPAAKIEATNMAKVKQPMTADIRPAGIPAPAPVVAQPAPPTPPPPVQTALTPGRNKTKVIILAGIVGLIVLFAGVIFLTEQGIIGIGLEKIYGFVHLEALWKGLPENPENAFALAAGKMKTEKSFKVEGNATITVNRGVNSDIVSPIVSAAAGDTTEDTSFYNSISSSTMAEVVEVTAKISSQVTSGVSGAKINLKSKKSPNSEIELVYSSGKMYLKTSDDIVYDKKAKGSWLAYDIKNFGQGSPGETLWGSNFSDSNFSIVGERSGNESIDGIRCYHYSGQVTLGSALESFGLFENSVQSMDVDFWLGVKDHLIHRLEMKIIPNSSAAISRIEMSLDFSDYGGGGGDFIIPATSVPASGAIGQTGSSGQPTPGQAAASTAEQLRDSQRKSDLSDIAEALEEYFALYKKYPIVAKTEKIGATGGILNNTLTPNYITALPLDPLDPKYYYGYESDGTKYTLSAVIEDKSDPEGSIVGSAYLYFLKSQ